MLRSLTVAIILMFLFACNNNDSGGTDVNPNPPTIAPPVMLTSTIDSVFPHDTAAYTQGLIYYKGKLIEATGDYENSSLRIVDIKTGKPEKIHKMGTEDIFGEGITLLHDTIYQLTWQSNIVYLYHLNDITKPVKTFKWPHEGWGITTDGKNLFVSDGTANIYTVSPTDFRVLSQVAVTDNNGNIDNINELEYVNGFIYANVYQTDFIIKIDPSNGHVVGKLALPNLIQTYDAKEVTNRTDVLNGIAYDSTNNKFYITGKRWPKLFRFSLN